MGGGMSARKAAQASNGARVTQVGSDGGKGLTVNKFGHP